MDMRGYFDETSVLEDSPRFLKTLFKDLCDMTMAETEEAFKVIISSIIDFYDVFNEVSELHDMTKLVKIPYEEFEQKTVDFLIHLDTDFDYVQAACNDVKKEGIKDLKTIFNKAYLMWMSDVRDHCVHLYKNRRNKNTLL